MDERSLVRHTVGAAMRALGVRAVVSAEDSAFYHPPADLPGEPGAVVRAEPARFYLDPLRVVPAPARAERIMFTSTDRLGRVVPVTGTVLTPTRPRSRRPDRGLVAFGVGTQGMAPKCAPSRQLAAGREYESVFIAGLLARGYNVVVPDYQGLGVRGVHAYMSREAQGRVVLDALRAAQQVDLPDIPRSGPVGIMGYSQGGGAAASAAELAHDYAPRLDIRGVVAGAVPGDLAELVGLLDGGPYFAMVGYAMIGLAADYGLDLGPLLNDHGHEILARLTEQCLFESVRRFAFTSSAELTVDGRSLAEILAEEPFAAVVTEQRIGHARWPRMPVLVTHSRFDDVVPFEAARSMATRWAEQGARVRLAPNLAPSHAVGTMASYRSAFAFLSARFAGRPLRGHTPGLLTVRADGTLEE